MQDKLKYYLGTGLKCETPLHDGVKNHEALELLSIDGEMVKFIVGGEINWVFVSEVKPLMRPLTSLTKPITIEGYIGGEPFVPMGHIHKLKLGSIVFKGGSMGKLCLEKTSFAVVQFLCDCNIWIFDQSDFKDKLIEITD